MITIMRGIAVFLFLSGSVFAQSKYTPEHPVAPVPASTVIVIDHGEVKINGCILNFPARIEMMERFFGPPSRRDEKWAAVWDDYGLSVVSKPYKNTAVGVEFRIRVQKKKEIYGDEREPSKAKIFLVLPDEEFPGDLIVDGVEITKDLTRDQFMLWKKGKGIRRSVFYREWRYGLRMRDREDMSAGLKMIFLPRDNWKVEEVHLMYASAIPSLKYGARVDDDEIVCVDDSEVVRKAKANKPSEAEMLQRELKSLLQEGMKVFSD